MTLDSFWLALTPLQQPLLALGVLLFSRFAPLPASYQPWGFVKAVVFGLRRKVVNAENGATQQVLAGSLAVLVVLLPVLLLLIAFAELSAWPEFFGAFLLYLSLDWQTQHRQLQAVAQSLDKQQLSLAKDQLAPLVLRKTANLSQQGIAKAALDTLALRLSKHWFAVLFWYMVGGGIVAFGYRLVLEMQQQWNPKLSTQRDFGTFISRFETLCSLIPSLFHALLLALWVNLGNTWIYFKSSSDRHLPWASRWVLSAWAAALQCNLAGPLYYEDAKINRVRIGHAQQPSAAHLARALRISLQLQRLTVFLIVSFIALKFAAL